MPRALRLLLAVLLLAAGVLCGWYFLSNETPPIVLSSSPPAATSETSKPPKLERREAGQPALIAVTPFPLANPADRSTLADSLGTATQTGLQDMAVVLSLFDYYRQTFGGLPAGENNAQIVNALAGNNPQRLALIERSHPAINKAGELTDRWGTPYFFHLISHEAVEIRSGGPDKKLWSEDDMLIASPSLRKVSHGGD